MLGKQRDSMRIHELPGVAQQHFVERGRSAERQRQAVADKRIALGKAAQVAAARATLVAPVLRSKLGKIDGVRDAGFQRRDEFAPKAQPGTGRAQGLHAYFMSPLFIPSALGAFFGVPHLPSPHLPSGIFLSVACISSCAAFLLVAPHFPSAGLVSWLSATW